MAQQRQRQAVRIQYRVGFLLPGVAGERLLEVSGLVQEPDADQRHTEVGGGLEVVAGEDAPGPPGILWEYFGDAEFGREVRDASRSVFAEALVPARFAEVSVQVAAACCTRSTTSPSLARSCNCSRLIDPSRAMGSCCDAPREPG